MSRARKAGFGIEPPSKSCDDKNCPFHGTLKTRGKLFTGTVVSDKMQKAVIIEWLGWRHIPKYERYRKTRTRVVAHNPPCIDAKEGDLVRVGECRPLSKTKTFVVLKVLGKEEKYQLEKEALEEGKHKEKAKEAAKEKVTKDIREPEETREAPEEMAGAAEGEM